MARSPVPADGSRTRSVEVGLAAVLAASPSSMGVRELLQSLALDGAAGVARQQRRDLHEDCELSHWLIPIPGKAASEPPNDCSMAQRKIARSIGRRRGAAGAQPRGREIFIGAQLDER